jgi:hypothetical protein
MLLSLLTYVGLTLGVLATAVALVRALLGLELELEERRKRRAEKGDR